MPAEHPHLYVLGLLRLYRAGQPVSSSDQARLQNLLTYLVLQRDSSVSRQQLAFSFWPDTDDQNAFRCRRCRRRAQFWLR